MAPPRSTRCPRCGFSFAWNGRTCGHCPSPERARQLWEQVRHLPELVRTDKGITPRQLVMIAAGCLRRVDHLLQTRVRGAADRLEDDPDNFAREWSVKTVDVRTVQTVCSDCCRVAGRHAYPDRELLSFQLPPALEFYRDAIAAALEGANDPYGRRTRGETDPVQVAIDHLRRQLGEYERQQWQAARVEEAAQCAIARDVLGYPEVTVRFDPEWRTSTAIAITRGMYESRDFGGMPILADALQDAGCDEPEILEHCRADREHVRGCWVCEWVLGTVG